MNHLPVLFLSLTALVVSSLFFYACARVYINNIYKQKGVSINGKKVIGLSFLGFVFLVTLYALAFTITPVKAATGINRTINFQGKLTNSDGTNVTNGNYSIVFSFYDVGSSGTALWSETQSVTVTGGVFRVALGASTPIPTDFNFNWDGLYLGMKVGSDSEMSPRIRMTAAAYAFNAEKVAGLTVQDTSGNASTSGTLQVANGQTITFGNSFNSGTNSLSFTTSGSTTLSFGGSGGLTLVDTTNSQTLANKSFTDSTNGFVDNGDATKVLKFDAANIGSGTTLTLSLPSSPGTSDILCLQTKANCGGANFLVQVSGNGVTNGGYSAIGNLTTDFFVGGLSTQAAKFAVLNINTGTPIASIAGNISLGGPVGTTRTIGATAMNALQLGDVNTDDLYFAPGNNIAMMVENGGNIGIGTTTPLEKLHMVNAGGGYSTFRIDSGVVNGQLYSLLGINAFHVGTKSDHHLVFDSNDTERMRIDNIGNVGIGTNSPIAALDIRGNFGTTPAASIAAYSDAFAGLVVDNRGLGDILVASTAGVTKFAIRNNGSLYSSQYQVSGGLLYGQSNGTIAQSSAGTSGQCLQSNGGGAPTWGECGAAGRDAQLATADLGNVTLANTATYLNTVSVTPSSVTGDVIVRALLWTRSLSATDQTITVQIRVASGSTCNGSLLVSQTASLVSANGANGPAVFATYLEPNPGVTLKSYAICALSTTNSGAAAGGLGSAEVIDSGTTQEGGGVFLVNANGTLSTANVTRDLLLGSDATSGAKFAVLNIAGGTPVASISAQNGLGQALVLGGDGSIQSVRDNTLTFGGATTGDIQFRAGDRLGMYLRSNGDVFVGSTYTGTLASLDIRPNYANSGGTLAVASVSGRTSFAGLIADNSLGDIFTASASGSTRAVITNAGQLSLPAQGVNSGLLLGGDTTIYRSAGTTLTSNATALNFSSAVLTVSSCVGCGGGSSDSFFIQQTGNGVSTGGYTALGNLTTDFFVGGMSTQAAKFAVLNVNGALTPIASIAGTLSLGSPVGTTRTIGTTAMNSLQLGNATTGDLLFAPANTPAMIVRNGGNVGIGTTVPGALLDVAGSLLLGANSTIDARAAGTITLAGGSNTSGLILGKTAGTLSLPSTSITLGGFGGGAGNSNAVLYVNASNALAQAVTTGSSQCLLSNGSGGNPSWGTCPGGSGGTQYLIQTTGNGVTNGGYTAIGNLTTDFFVGGLSTQAAKFAVLNVNGALTPIASIAGTLSLGSPVGTTRTIGTTAMNALQLGDVTTGDLLFAPGNVVAMTMKRSGYVGIGTTSPLAKLHIDGNATTAIASVSGTTSFATMVVDNDGIGDLFTASSSGRTRFTINQNGNIVMPNYNGNNAILFGTVSTGVLAAATTNTAAQCIVSDAGGANTPGWGTCLTGSNTNWWTLNAAQGTMYAANTTVDLLWGGISTASAGFRLSGATTNYGTVSVASISANTSFAAMVIDNKGSGDLFTASSSGNTRFVIMQNGNVGIGTTSASEKLQVNGNIQIESMPDASNGQQTTWTKISQTTAGTIAPSGTTGIASISASVVYNGSLYVGTYRENIGTAEVYRYDGGAGQSWTKVSQSTAGTIAASGTANIASVSAMTVFDGSLYIGTSKVNSAEVYRYEGGTTWTKVSGTTGTIGGNATTGIDGVSALGVYQGRIVAGTREAARAEVYRHNGGSSWTKISNATAGLFVTTNTATVNAVTSFAVLNGILYAGTAKVGDGDVIKYTGGLTWISVNLASTTGSYSINGSAVTGFNEARVITYNGSIIVGLQKTNAAEVLNMTDTGALVTNTFTRLNHAVGGMTNGGTTNIDGIASMTIYNGILFIGTMEPNGAEIYRYVGGDQRFFKVSQATAGTIASGGTAAIDAVTVLQQLGDNLYAGTQEIGKAEVYQYTAAIDRSYALQFRASPQIAGGEQSGFYNEAALYYVASASANLGSNAGNTGAIVSTHGIQTRNGSYDVAEDYPTRDESIEPGNLVAMDANERGFVRKTAGRGDTAIMGIYSEKPALRLTQTDATINGGRAIPIALVGRVPAKVTTENGPIKVGDSLMASSIPGVAMKATKAGAVVGQAMEAYDEEGVGKVMVYVSTGSYLGNADALEGKQGVVLLSELVEGSTISSAASMLYTDTLAAGLEIVTPHVTAQTVSLDTLQAASGDEIIVKLGVNGTMNIVNETGEEIIAFDNKGNGTFGGTVSAQTVALDTIEARTSNAITVKLGTDGTFTIINDLGEEVVAFDDKGNGTFAGTLTADTLKVAKIDGLDIMVQDVLSQQLGFGSAVSVVDAPADAIASLSATVASQSAQITSLSEMLRGLIAAINGGTSSESASIAVLGASTSTNLTLADLSSDGLATVSGNLRVRGNTLVEGMLSVVDSVTTPDIIVTNLATFFSETVFKGSVRFDKTALFSQDSAGTVVMPKGQETASVSFAQEYQHDPIVTVSVEVKEVDDEELLTYQQAGICLETDTKATCFEKIQEKLLSSNLQFIVTQKSRKGFTIRSNKAVPMAIPLSWIVIQTTKPPDDP